MFPSLVVVGFATSVVVALDTSSGEKTYNVVVWKAVVVQSQSSSVLLREVAAASQVVELPALEVQLAVPVPTGRTAVLVVLYPAARGNA